MSHRNATSYVMVFDVETTGLFPKSAPFSAAPYITQMSIIVYDSKKNKIVRAYNNYVAIPPQIELPDEVSEKTGIKREMLLRENGAVSIVEALTVFYTEYQNADIVVAHNLEFDSRMILVEFQRNRFDVRHSCYFWGGLFQPENVGSQKQMFCTMKAARNEIKLWVKKPVKGVNYRIKYPKLSELFQVLFPAESEPANLHNSLVDSLICLRCFIKLVTGDDVANPQIHSVKKTNYMSLLHGGEYITPIVKVA